MALKIPPYLPIVISKSRVPVVNCNLNGFGKLREDRGFSSYKKFDQEGNLPKGLIKRAELGNGIKVSPENFCRLAERLGMTPKELFKWLKNYQAQTRRTSSHSAAEWLKPLATSPAPSLQALPGELR